MYKKSKFIAYILCFAMIACIGYLSVDKFYLSKKNKPNDMNATSENEGSTQKGETLEQEDNIDESEYFTVCSHDLGYFNYSTKLHYEGEDINEQFENWKKTVAELKSDFYFCQEYQTYFDPSYVIPSEEIFNETYKYNHIFSNAYGSAGVMSDFRLVDTDIFRLTSTQPGYEQTNRPGVLASVKAGDKLRVWLASFTLFTSKSPETSAAAREEQLQQLLDNRWIRKGKYVIIAGNLNSDDENLRRLLTENGFTLCVNDTPTIDLEGNYAIDNIAVKGFDIVEVNVYPEKRCTSNHYPIVAKLKPKD